MKALSTKIVTLEIATDAPLRVLRNKALWQGGPPAAGQYTCEVRQVTVAVAQPPEEARKALNVRQVSAADGRRKGAKRPTKAKARRKA